MFIEVLHYGRGGANWQCTDEILVINDPIQAYEVWRDADSRPEQFSRAKKQDTESIENTFVRHFLLGNNIIGPAGARLISAFVLAHLDRMETWYLAGNCIDLAGFERLVSAWTSSTAITNIWLKQNPLGPTASTAVYNLITKTSELRTLDLDETELGDEGVAHLFSLLELHNSPTSLRHIYLNAVGIGQSACKSLAITSHHRTAPSNLCT